LVRKIALLGMHGAIVSEIFRDRIKKKSELKFLASHVVCILILGFTCILSSGDPSRIS
jgi:hypothetical protein